MERTIAFTVNGQARTVTTDPDRPLLEVLREDLDLTGTKYGCGEGRCGACTVLLGGRPVASCVTPVARAEKQSISTIEGLAEGEKLHPVQEAFLSAGAIQCGYCTPGMVMAVAGLLAERPALTGAEILSRMDGHICRCNGYPKLKTAIENAAADPRRQK